MHSGKQSWAWTECSPIFWHSFLVCCVLCSRCMTKNNRLQRRNSRQFFHETSLARWVLCGRFATKKCDLHGRNSRHFFSETTFGLPSRLHPTRRSRDVLLWFLIQKAPFWDNFEVFLGSKTVLWTHSRLLGPIWRPGGPQGQNSTIFPPPVLGPFLEKFLFWGENVSKSIKKSRVCAQCNFWTIFDRFWGHFWRSKMVSSIVNSSQIAFWTFCEKSKIRCSFGGPFWRLLGSWIAHYTPPRRSEARKLRRWELRQF